MVLNLLLTSASILGVTIAINSECGHWSHTLGFGYNIVQGDPWRGLLGQGPTDPQDPGFEHLKQIVYTDEVKPYDDLTCDSSARSATIESTSSLQSSMEDTAKISAGIPLIFSFSASTSYKTAKELMKSHKEVFVKSSVTCGVQEAGLPNAALYDEGGDAPKMNPIFVQAVKDLPTDLHDIGLSYYRFLHSFGTHFVTDVVMGASYTEITTWSAAHLTTSFSSQVGVTVAASGTLEDTLKLGVGGGHKSGERKTFASSSNYASVKKLLMGGPITPSSKFEDWASISRKCPTPLEYTLMETFRLLNSKNFPKDDSIQIKRNLLKQALKSYCKVYVLGHLDKDCALDAYDVEMNYYRNQVGAAVHQRAALANQLVQVGCDNGKIPISCAWQQNFNAGGKQPPAWFTLLVSLPDGGYACQCLANPWVGGTCYAECVSKDVVHGVHLLGHMPSGYTEGTTDHNAVVQKFHQNPLNVNFEPRYAGNPPGVGIKCCDHGYTAIGCMGQLPARNLHGDTFPSKDFPDLYGVQPAQRNGKSCCQFRIEMSYAYSVYGQAVCASNIDDYQIVEAQGKGGARVDVHCPVGTYLLTCGYRSLGPERTKPGYYPVGKDLLNGKCSCYNWFGVTCYAACGSFQVKKSASASRRLYDISESGPIEGELIPKAKVQPEDKTDAEAEVLPVAVGSDTVGISLSPISTIPGILSILAVGGVAVVAFSGRDRW
jgi:hypothetical protein